MVLVGIPVVLLIPIFLILNVSEGHTLRIQKRNAGLLEAMPKSCKDKDYCFEKSQHYPQSQINDLVTKYFEDPPNVYEEVTSNDADKNLRDRQRREVNPGSASLFGYDIDIEQPDCPMEVNHDLLYEIVDENGAVRFVIQSPNKFAQIVRTERCLTPGKIVHPTFHLQSPHLYNLSCEDTKMDFAFWVVTLDGKGVELVKSRNGIPVSCQCKYTYID